MIISFVNFTLLSTLQKSLLMKKSELRVLQIELCILQRFEKMLKVLIKKSEINKYLFPMEI